MEGRTGVKDMSRARAIIEKQITDIMSTMTCMNLELLEGAGLSRIQHWVTQGVPFAMITAFRHNNSNQVNDSLNSQLISSLNSKGLGGIQLVGYWQESGDTEPTKEKSFFVPYTGGDEHLFRKLMQDLCGQYNQDAVLYSDGKNVGFLDRGGSFTPAFSSISFGSSQIKQGWSELRGRKFTFVECAFYTGSNAGRQVLNYYGILPGVSFDKKSIQEAMRLKASGQSR